MDKRYITLFKDLAQATAVSAEQVMDYDKAQNDEKGFETAKIMRDDYQELTDKLVENGENFVMTKPDCARLLVGAMIQVNQLQDRLNSLKKAMTGYQTDLIPKLQDVLDGAEDDEAIAQLANEKFIIENNE